MHECTREACFVPDVGCVRGYLLVARCPDWTADTHADQEADDPGDEILLPWTSAALGLADVAFLAGRGRPTVVGVLGAENAGKTTLLAAWYLLLGRQGLGPGSPLFAGSCTLAGWEAVAGAMRWAPGRPPTFPPHTASGGGRTPGLLHLAFSSGPTLRVADYLFADAPGEWFRRWAMNREADAASGARWLADRADVLLLVADRAALAGDSRGQARGDLQFLARRLAAERSNQPVALVWTKSDVEVDSGTERMARESVRTSVPDAVEFRVGVTSPDGFLALLAWTLSQRRSGVVLPPPRIVGDHPLLHFAASNS